MKKGRERYIWVVVITILISGKLEESVGIDVTVNTSQKYQTIEGFGGGLMFGVWPYGRKCKDELYDSIFRVARCNIVRIKNDYDPEADTTDSAYKEVTEIPMMKEIQEKYPDVKITIASWSPPKYLKEGDTIAGIVNGKKLSLKK
ncbi:MAG: hypothetical protein N2053_11235, partial [Chitinispirillaceae bacterium]|nr:hypothetical protein [Chitinispirillaceae bacterium]